MLVIIGLTLGVEAAIARIDPVPGGKIASNCWTPNIPVRDTIRDGEGRWGRGER